MRSVSALTNGANTRLLKNTMSRKHRGGRKQPSNIADITINDYANATVCTRRAKKTHINTILENLKVDDKDWDENNYDGEFTQTVNPDGSLSYVITKPVEPNEEFLNKRIINYELPIDVWFLIGKFIPPEDVGRFSRICRASYSVVCCAKFWIDLYKKYYTTNINIPDDLKPDHLKRKFGVRTLTVRTLFLMYPPFCNRLIRSARAHPKDTLIKRKCSLMWHVRKKGIWSFYFKLEELGVSQRYKNLDLLDKLDDVFANPDEHCKILLVNTQTFTALPPVQNYVLCDVNVSLSHDLVQQRLKLAFSEVYFSRRDGSIEITIGNVINYKVLDWWHPDYPRTNTLEIFLNGD